ncbi:MAG: hypothetical protein E6J66_03045 [Deltaproteobacteria bacterium]|nr:MAG: hypothetical protein E6J66_03045 [Deltaproteobacteria bacterium]
MAAGNKLVAILPRVVIRLLQLLPPRSERLAYRLKRPLPGGREVLALQPVELLRRMATLVPPPRCHVRTCAGGCRRSEPGLHAAAARAARVRALRVARRAFVVVFAGAPRPAAIRPLESQPPASAFLVDARHVSP